MYNCSLLFFFNSFNTTIYNYVGVLVLQSAIFKQNIFRRRWLSLKWSDFPAMIIENLWVILRSAKCQNLRWNKSHEL